MSICSVHTIYYLHFVQHVQKREFNAFMKFVDKSYKSIRLYWTIYTNSSFPLCSVSPFVSLRTSSLDLMRVGEKVYYDKG